MGGLSRRFVKINEIIESGADPIILDAGDLFFSTARINSDNRESEYFRAQSILDGYSRIGCDLINIGHYELLGGLSFLNTMSEKYKIPFISANLRSIETDDLLFDPYKIINKNGFNIGVIGVTDKLPDTCKTIIADDFIDIGKKYISELKQKVDIVVILVNAERAKQEELVDHFAEADFIATSGSTNLTRPKNSQKEGGPYLYSLGKQGKYLSVLDIELNDVSEPIFDVSSHQTNIKSIVKRLDRLQKKDPKKDIRDIYADQKNVLKLIDQYEDDLRELKVLFDSAVNRVSYQTLALNKKIQDNEEILSFVNASLSTCNSLNPKSTNKKAHDHKKSKKP